MSGLPAELANLRNAFRWAADRGDLDVAVPIATYATLLGVMVETYEPVAWAEELIQPARAVEHPRLISLYVMATHCQIVGRIEEAQQYGDAGQILLTSGHRCVPPGLESWLGGIYTTIGQPGRSIELFRELLASDEDPYALTASGLSFH